MAFTQGHALIIGVGAYQHAPGLNEPVVEAARAGDWSALAALGGVLAGVGSNLLAVTADFVITWRAVAPSQSKIAI